MKYTSPPMRVEVECVWLPLNCWNENEGEVAPPEKSKFSWKEKGEQMPGRTKISGVFYTQAHLHPCIGSD